MTLFFCLLSTLAHADYFELDQRVRNEESARAAAESLARGQQQVAQHNADLQAVVAAFGQGQGGAYNLNSRGCGERCSFPYDLSYRLRDQFVDTITFTTGRGYECYAQLWPVGREIGCLHPQTKDRIYIDPLANRNGKVPRKRAHR